ncbi:hypothetical protein CF326_g6443 [Tilletia indica]|nr:hypothetical protein CF326_g6443 [Tilletia indica]
MLSKLAKFPDTPKQPFIHLTNTFTAMAVHYLYILNTFAMQTDDERERISEREDQIEDLENTIANLRERVRLFKEDARDVRKKERKTSDQRNPRLTSVETFELEKEIRYLRADVAKRDKTIAKRDDELADLKEIMHHRDEQNSKRVAEVKKDLQRYKDKALTVLEAKNGHIERLRTELIGIADGTISAEDSKLIAGERRGLETTRNSSIHPLRALM